MKSGNFSVEFVNANEISVVSNISNALAKGQSTQVSIYKSLDDNMNKGRGANKNPYIGRVYKLLFGCTYLLHDEWLLDMVEHWSVKEFWRVSEEKVLENISRALGSGCH